MNKRLVFAVVITLAVYVAAGQLASVLTPSPAPTTNPDHYFWLLAGISATVHFLAVFAGTLIARGRFLVPALLLWAIPTAAVMAIGYRLQIPAGPVDFGTFALRNLPMLSATLAGTLAGVACGKFLANHKRGNFGTQAAT